MLLHQYVNSRVSSTELYPSIVLFFRVKPFHNGHLGTKEVDVEERWPLWLVAVSGGLTVKKHISVIFDIYMFLRPSDSTRKP